MEVMEEEELAAMRAHQQHYEQVCPVPPNLSLIMARQAIRTLHCCGLASGTCRQLFTAVEALVNEIWPPSWHWFDSAVFAYVTQAD